MEPQTTPPTSFVTENTAGRKPTLADAEAIFNTYAQDPEVTRYLVFKPYETLEDLQSWLSDTINEWDKKPGIMYLLHKREDPGVLIGSFSITIDEFKAEVGYLLAKPYWGHGIIAEVLSYWVDWALAQPKIFRIGAVCDVDNPASRCVMEKAGMEFEGTLRRWSMHPNVGVEPRDVHTYAKVR